MTAVRPIRTLRSTPARHPQPRHFRRMAARSPGMPVRHRPHAEPLEARMLLAADPAAFDASFGVGGKVRIDVDGYFEQGEFVTVLPDGNLLVSGTAGTGITAEPAASDSQP